MTTSLRCLVAALFLTGCSVEPATQTAMPVRSAAMVVVDDPGGSGGSTGGGGVVPYSFEWRGSTIWSAAQTHRLPPDGRPYTGRQELTLRLHYDLSCNLNDQFRFPGVLAEVLYRGTVRRIELLRFRHNHELNTGRERPGMTMRELQLGPYDPNEPITISWNMWPADMMSCSMVRLAAELDFAEDRPGQLRSAFTNAVKPDSTRYSQAEVDQLVIDQLQAERHAPFFAVRTNECNNPRTDIPYRMGWTKYANNCNPVTHQCDGTFTIRYLAVFSDEDDTGGPWGWGATTVPNRFVSYGRGGDTAPFYNVVVNGNGDRLSATYETYDFRIFYQNVKHAYPAYENWYPFLLSNAYTSSDHPAMFIYGDNNTLAHAQDTHYCGGGSLVGHQPVPLQFKGTAAGINDLIWYTEDPWMNWVTDAEHERERRREGWSTEYLFETIPNATPGAKPAVYYQLPRWGFYEPVWGMDDSGGAACSALQVGVDTLDGIQGGFGEGWTVMRPPDPFTPLLAQPTPPRFFRLIRAPGTYTAVELTDKIGCSGLFCSWPIATQCFNSEWAQTSCTTGCDANYCYSDNWIQGFCPSSATRRCPASSQCIAGAQDAYVSHFTGPGCTGTELYYLPYDGYAYSCRTWDGTGSCSGTTSTQTAYSYRYGNACFDAWPSGNTLSEFVTVCR